MRHSAAFARQVRYCVGRPTLVKVLSPLSLRLDAAEGDRERALRSARVQASKASSRPDGATCTSAEELRRETQSLRMPVMRDGGRVTFDHADAEQVSTRFPRQRLRF